MKKYKIVLFILALLVVDQALKFYIKTHFSLGQEKNIIGTWFNLHFVENEGLAWGWKLGGDWGKIILTLFRLVAVVFGVYYINKIINKKYHKGFIVCAGLIFAGALGNLIDSLFYGMLFENSDAYQPNVARFLPGGGGYAGFLHGKVVDMLYFPIIQTNYPSWFPWLGGQPLEFFSPVFNIADACISVGLIVILLYQKRFFKQHTPTAKHPVQTTSVAVENESQVL